MDMQWDLWTFCALWLAGALFIANIALSKGRPGLTWFAYGLLFWPVAMVNVVVVKPRRPRRVAAYDGPRLLRS